MMPGSERINGVIANYATSMAVILLGLWVHTRDGNFVSTEFTVRISFEFAGEAYSLGTADVLVAVAALYAVILLPYYAMRHGFICDARRVFVYVREWTRTRAQPDFTFEDRRAALTIALKFYFIPLMLGYLVNNIHEVSRHWDSVAQDDPATAYTIGLNTSFYFLILAVLYLIDVAIFAVGYMVETRATNNEIRSVDPTLLGWASCLICYPPFNHLGFAFLSWQQVDAEGFATPSIRTMLAWLSILALAIYAWASVALGLRASNLTNRGIVSKGPYRWIRHPAYAMKFIAIWIAAMPALADALAQPLSLGLWILSCMMVWTGIYLLRALTEERHLLMLDNGYAEYKAQVRYRFIPGLI